jgi:hypothetical protein
MAVSGLRNLCTPSYVYLVISAIALVVMMYQNMGNVDKYCLGSYSCNVSSTALIFVIKAVYILFWTWVLNLICRSGNTGVAWFVLLLPVILLFVVLGSMMFYNNTKEGMSHGGEPNPDDTKHHKPSDNELNTRPQMDLLNRQVEKNTKDIFTLSKTVGLLVPHHDSTKK